MYEASQMNYVIILIFSSIHTYCSSNASSSKGNPWVTAFFDSIITHYEMLVFEQQQEPIAQTFKDLQDPFLL